LPSPVGLDIALYERRAQEDPWSAADRAVLARLYMQRGRETGEYSDYQSAEAAARASLGLRRDRNEGSMLTLASSLLAQHRFVEAREAAHALVARAPDQVGSRALYAEILLELGDYAAADAEFALLVPFQENLAVAPRLARWHELNGRNEKAGAILVRSAEAALQRADLPAEQSAWFFLRVADHALRNGQLSRAGRAVAAGLEQNPGDPRLRSVRARLAFTRGRFRTALQEIRELGEAADMATLALGGDAARALGFFELAQLYDAQVERRARAQPEPFARQWTQFCLERGLYQDETLHTLHAEIRTRPDVLGHQLLAWAYYRAGRAEEAATQIRAALRLGTRDAQLHQLAAAILARPEHMDRARAINPHFVRITFGPDRRAAGTGAEQ
jgi:tetratricopeptide (TPR) repeat protein